MKHHHLQKDWNGLTKVNQSEFRIEKVTRDKEPNGEEITGTFYQQKSINHSLRLKSNKKEDKRYMLNRKDMVIFR